MAETSQMVAPQAALHSCWFFILSDGGLRISELEALTVSDWDAATQTLHIRYGKGGRERRIPLTSRASQAIAAHLKTRPEASLVRHKPLVMYQEQAIKPHYIRGVLHKFAAQAGLENVTPHRLRHTYATELAGAGIDLLALRELMGHASPETTAKYVHLAPEALAAEFAAARAVIGR